MSSDADRFLTLIIDVLRDAWSSLGAFAWLAAGVLLLAGATTLFVVWRWIYRGGTSRSRRLALFGNGRVEDRHINR